MRWYDRESGRKWFLAAAAILLAAAAVLCWAGRRAGEQADLYQARNEAAAAFAAHRPAPFGEDRTQFPASDFYSLQEEIPASGAVLLSLSEEAPEPLEGGRILKMKINGKGSFTQLLSLFDIIQMKTYWVTAKLIRAERKEGALLFEIGLSAYQGRGSYEEEKYRIDRSHGNGQEPGRADSR